MRFVAGFGLIMAYWGMAWDLAVEEVDSSKLLRNRGRNKGDQKNISHGFFISKLYPGLDQVEWVNPLALNQSAWASYVYESGCQRHP